METTVFEEELLKPSETPCCSDTEDFVSDGSEPHKSTSRCSTETYNSKKRHRKQCPTELAIFGRAIVDKFQYDLPGEGAVYFLSHFHSDHYGGLGPRWAERLVYCSPVTARLVVTQLRVDPKWVVALPIDPNAVHDIGCGVSVTLLDANHCPGSAMFLFRRGGETALHTGDFRYDPRIVPPYVTHVDLLHIDTTFCSSEYDFPPQEAVENTVVSLIANDKVIYVLGAYVVGKERLLVRIIRERKCKVCVEPKRLEVLRLLDLPADVLGFFTTERSEANVRVVSMGQLSAPRLAEMYEKEYSDKYEGIVGFSPTGWVYPELVPKKRSPGKGVRPYSMRRCGKCTVYCVPYSEHSSFGELRAFVKRVSPDVIYPFECPSLAKHVARILRGEVESHEGFAHVSIERFFSTPVKALNGGGFAVRRHNGDDSDDNDDNNDNNNNNPDALLALKLATEELNETPVKGENAKDVVDAQCRMLKFIKASNSFELRRKANLATPAQGSRKKRRKSGLTCSPEQNVDKTQRNLLEFFK